MQQWQKQQQAAMGEVVKFSEEVQDWTADDK